MHFRQDDQKQNLSFVYAGWKNPFSLSPRAMFSKRKTDWYLQKWKDLKSVNMEWPKLIKLQLTIFYFIQSR